MLIPNWAKNTSILVLLVLALLGFGKALTTNFDLNRYIKDYKAFQEKAQVTLVQNDSLKKVIARRDSVVAENRVQADSLQAKIEEVASSAIPLRTQISVLKARENQTLAVKDSTIAVQDALIARQDTQIVTQAKEITVLRKTDFFQDSIIQDLKVANGRLEQRLREVPKPPKAEKFLGFIPLPSRTAVAIGSIVTTAVVVHELEK